MPRHPRLFIPGATYHVYCRVARGEFVFDDDYEAQKFVETLREVRNLDSWTIYAWCLMGNHYHLVLKTKDVALWRSMARLQGRVSRAYNRRHRFLGRLWQCRYRARVIDTNEYFRHVVAYVHLNPVTAGIVSDPADYVYSGHREVIGSCKPHVIGRRSLLQGFEGSSIRDATDHYLDWIRAVAEARWAASRVSDLPWWSEARHVDEIADLDQHPEATTFDGRHLAEERRQLELSEFAALFESASGHSLSDLSSRYRTDRYVNGRVEFSLLAVNRYGFRVRDVSALLCKSGNSVTRWINRGLSCERDDEEFRTRINCLDSSISSRDCQCNNDERGTNPILLPCREGRIDDGESTVRQIPRAGDDEAVLLVEDNPAILSVGRKMLERLGYRVLTAGSPKEALAVAGDLTTPIQLLLTDVVMPEISGRELAGRVAALRPGIGILYMSGYTADVIARKGVLEDGVHFIQKPFSMAQLAAKAREVLDRDD